MRQSISNCSVRSWKTGLAAMCSALKLSQYKDGIFEVELEDREEDISSIAFHK